MTTTLLGQKRFVAAAGTLGLALLVAACGPSRNDYPEQVAGSEQHDPLGEHGDANRGRVFANNGSAQKAPPVQKIVEVKSANKTGVGINEYLWRASLDTLSFMPLLSADPFGGVIITDWYSNPQTPNERLKVQTYILSKDLRADGLQVSVFRQERTASGWQNSSVSPDTKIKLENAILTQARQLRVAARER